MKVIVNTDGGLITGPFGRAGAQTTMTSCGFVIKSNPQGKKLLEGGQMTGKEGTNNDAEYEGVILGLKSALELGATHVTLRVDSQMVCYQITGKYQCKHDHLRAHLRHAKSYAKMFKKFRVEWVPREQNSRADGMCHVAMDAFRRENGLPTRAEAKKDKSSARARKRKQEAANNAMAASTNFTTKKGQRL